jgi:hypothetical protein
MDVRETGCGCIDWTALALCKDHGQAFVKMIMGLRFYHNFGKFMLYEFLLNIDSVAWSYTLRLGRGLSLITKCEKFAFDLNFCGVECN